MYKHCSCMYSQWHRVKLKHYNGYDKQVATCIVENSESQYVFNFLNV